MSEAVSKSNKPSHYAKVRHGSGENATYEQIGAAWENENGSLYVKLTGTQIVSDGFTLYPVESPDEPAE